MAIQKYTPALITNRPALRLRDIAWFAGLTEGEASFLWHSTPSITIQMTDYDIITRISHLTEYGITTYKPRGKESYKQVWGIRIMGARAAGWMMTLYPFMGERRQAKIRELLLRWKSAPGFPRGRKGERLPAICHPERLRFAKGLCKQCYSRQIMQTWRLETKATCHPERTVKGYGLCNPCYLREYRAKLAGKPSLLDGIEQTAQIATCHPERPHFSKGLCGSCYMQQWRQNKATPDKTHAADEPLTEPEQLVLYALKGSFKST